MPQILKTWDTGAWDSGFWDSTVAQSTYKIMNAKVATNLVNLKPREKLAKFQKAVTKCGEAPALPNPNPTLVVCTAGNDALKTNLDQIDLLEQSLTNLRITRDQLLATATTNYTALGACVQSFAQGNPAVITQYGYDVAGLPGTVTPNVIEPVSISLTHGDQDGDTDVSWHRNKLARSTEVQTSPDPMTDATWTQNQIATKSSCTIKSKLIGSKLWVRIRSITANGPGLWSEPAFIIVT